MKNHTSSPSAMPAGSYDTLVVHRLELRDKADKLRGLWTVTDDGPTLVLLDTTGKKVRAALGADAKGSYLTLYDPAGKPRAHLTVNAKGLALVSRNTAGRRRTAVNEYSLFRR